MKTDMTAPVIDPSAPIVDRMLRPFQEFARAESSGGIALLLCTALALAWANSPWSASYFHLWETPMAIGVPGAQLEQSLHHWINDGLMVVFFFLVGLEIKREMLVGELASARKAAFPVAAAMGGMLVPALIYAALNAGTPGAAGWGVPMATDIAFALGVLALLGPRIPVSLKVFLAALAIADDIGAVLVIALFYTARISWASLAAGGVVLGLLLVANAAGVRRPAVYAGLGVLLWLAFLRSGVHATVAGVVLAMTVPARTRIRENEFLARVRAAAEEFEGSSGPEANVMSNRRQQEAVHALENACEEVQSPLLRMEQWLHSLVAFAIMPLFALANAGVRVDAGLFGTLAWRVALGVVLGLVLGKPLGIMLLGWASQRLKVASAPGGVSWGALHGVSWLAGIGFTMSLFVADLAFTDPRLLDSAKVGVLTASITAGIMGWLLLRGGAVAAVASPAASGCAYVAPDADREPVAHASARENGPLLSREP